MRQALDQPSSMARRLRLASLTALVVSCSGAPASTVATLTLVATHSVGDAGMLDEKGLHLSANQGGEVTLSRALVTLSSVELLPCPSATGQLLRWLSPIGSAWAHGVTTPRRLGVPNVIDLRAEQGRLVTLGQLLPPAGRYCQARVTFGPIDADGAVASGFPEMKGSSMDLVGEIRTSVTASSVPIALRSQAVVGVEVDLHERSFVGGASEDLTFELPLAGVFEGVDTASNDAAGEVLARVAAAARAMP